MAGKGLLWGQQQHLEIGITAPNLLNKELGGGSDWKSLVVYR